ncbi:surface polysaccharide O-acyltransferase-like enzyme [Epilithonimonas hungarica]|uniref:acyltransferase family protein n=1 Tax=Epilithonimonas hungarica TaxID=454006 RepID=UPI002782BAF1|nr:acyltransferase family protein [Epilithonimonas hungarica]MDP9956825.1 surface polysaccharide O-acyltransferase-like enzyme [Epilithonimonas hungarica]
MEEISINKSNQLKVIAILMMLCLHLFNKDYNNLFEPLIFIGSKPLSYYISLFCDACVPIFAFVSGYGLYFKYQQNSDNYVTDNFLRLKKLYINYWIIIAIFPVIIGSIIGKEGFPGSFVKLSLNLSGLSNTYNGAWWFFTVYVIFVLSSGFWFRLMEYINVYLYVILLFCIYIIFFYFRVYKADYFDQEILDAVQDTVTKFFCTLFQFMLGAFALKFKWNTKITKIFSGINFKNQLIIILIFGLVVLHGLIPNFIIAPFTGLCFLMLFNQLDLNKYFVRFLDFLNPHCTNMWLIHMFFYLVFFQNFIYSFQYPIIIFFVLVLLCLLSSYIINFIYNKILIVIK